MQPSTEPPVRPEMMDALRRRAGAKGVLDFAEFMDVALYEPGLGYYRRDRERIGYAPGTDFLTATASSPLFGRLVAAACTSLLGGADPGGFDFVELGAERGSGILDGRPHPFRSARAVGLGESWALKGPSVVFSNELFDAQPFRRFRYRGGAWRELGVAVGAGALAEAELAPGEPLPLELPEEAPEGYVIDAPLASAALARAIASVPWEGLFLAFDYGKSWEELVHGAPEGTARA